MIVKDVCGNDVSVGFSLNGVYLPDNAFWQCPRCQGTLPLQEGDKWVCCPEDHYMMEIIIETDDSIYKITPVAGHERHELRKVQ